MIFFMVFDAKNWLEPVLWFQGATPQNDTDSGINSQGGPIILKNHNPRVSK